MRATLYTNLKPKMKIKNRSEIPKTNRYTKKKKHTIISNEKKSQRVKNTLKKIAEIIKKKPKIVYHRLKYDP